MTALSYYYFTQIIQGFTFKKSAKSIKSTKTVQTMSVPGCATLCRVVDVQICKCADVQMRKMMCRFQMCECADKKNYVQISNVRMCRSENDVHIS
jgi:hypothetical protein